jgi:hypothetical protein
MVCNNTASEQLFYLLLKQNLSGHTLKYNASYITQELVFRTMCESVQVSSSSDEEAYVMLKSIISM